MSDHYETHYYNYQIAIVFAILIGGCLFLALVFAAIYFTCIVNMRKDKRRSVVTTPLPIRRTDYGQPPYSTLQNQQQTVEYTVRPPAQSYSQQQLVQPYNTENIPGDARIQPLRPEFSYQQGPMTWTTMSPIQETHQPQYPISPTPAPQNGGGYNISSV